MTKVEALALMLDCFPDEIITPAMNATMLEACGLALLESVVRCCSDIRHSKAERKYGDSFSSLFSRHLRKVDNELRIDRRRATEQRQIEPPVVQISDEERQRRVAVIKSLKPVLALSTKAFDVKIRSRAIDSRHAEKRAERNYLDVEAMKFELDHLKENPIIPASMHSEDAPDTFGPLEGEHEKRAVND